ncbi:MAG: sulfotransferase family 2 domain-containing protein [Rhodobacterales bacterium]|nr:sulfotransferase family 2 domain-containing protein [Rhodobacterales bacterium]
MLVFAKAKLVFLSVPKTGSTSYEKALAPIASMAITDPPDLKHAPIYRYNRFIRPMLEKFICEDIEIMAVVREPVSWLGSWYRYRKRPHLEGAPNSTHGLTFDDFVLAYLKGKKPAYANVGSQAKFLEPQVNGTQLKYLFRYEDQPKIIAFLENRLGIDLELPQLNTSPSMDLTLSSEIEAKYRRKCAEEFSLWASAS